MIEILERNLAHFAKIIEQIWESECMIFRVRARRADLVPACLLSFLAVSEGD